MNFLSKFFGNENERQIKSIQPIIEKINSLEPTLEKLTDEGLKNKTIEFRQRLEKGETLDDLLPEAFACVREASKRTLKKRHFDCQLMGGIFLHRGNVVEMKTGEGKTLTATLAVYLHALSQKGAHVITVNDYLARRDAVWMGQVYDFLGLTVSCLNNEQTFKYDPLYKKPEEQKEATRDELGGFFIVEDYLKPCTKKEAYLCDITYGTNNEFGFDYLRDNMVYDKGESLRYGFNFAIVDEVDSILIDEARTPLIISGVMPEEPSDYYRFSEIAQRLHRGTDYEIEEKSKSVKLTNEGEDNVSKILGFDPWQDVDFRAIHRLENSLRAKEFYWLDRDYVVRGDEIIIVDEFTGRLMPGRRWSEGLHQAVESKEHISSNPQITVRPESVTLATITFQNLFRKYGVLSGMTGTAETSAEEFDKVYKMNVVVIPTNKPQQRKDLPDKIYKNEKGKLSAIVKEIAQRHKTGQPILVGTRSIDKSEYIGKLLEIEGIPHQILNAKNHEKEAQIIAQAGKAGQVTIATNMAGRGVDIILGGNPPNPEETEKIKAAGGLCVLGTERHEARRIDNQLRGRSGRQGDNGLSCFYVSLEDDLMRIFGGEQIKSMMERFQLPEDEAIEHNLISRAIESAQSRVEGNNFDIRKHLLEYDDVMNMHREWFYRERQKIIEFDDKQIREYFVDTIKECGKDLHEFEEKEKQIAPEKMGFTLRFLFLRAMDALWIEHLESMNHLQSSVGIRAFGQLDPVIEYKKEGHRLFQRLTSSIAQEATDAFFALKVAPDNPVEEPKSVVNIGQNSQVGRNDPCPCGSGKKYKKCCGRDAT